jgi:serine/threonine-protein kinase RsbW
MCQLCVAEGFTNAVRHAHRGKPPDWPIDLEVVMQCDQIEIWIWDRGEPFDLEARLLELPDVLNTDAEGGRGLKLMKMIADVLTYTRSDNGTNCLYIAKRYTNLPSQK